jgi:pyrimidine-specific ribonucleoside hydrolase
MSGPQPPSRVPVLLDVDTGVDDACALLLAATHPRLDLRGVSCVAGNVGVDQVVTNTLTVLAAAGRQVPVARGADRPLLGPARDAEHVHGRDGMGDLGWPAPAAAPDPRHGVELLRDLLLAAAAAGERITLVPLAPMTNIALLLRSYPQVAAGLERIVFMGGSALVGNVTASAEFNVWHDPEAAAITLDAAADLDLPVTMYGLDVFTEVLVSRQQARDLAGRGGPAARLGAALVGFACDRFRAEAATLGDAGAVCAVIDPDRLGVRRLPVRVELAGTWTRGRTVVDQRDEDLDVRNDPHGRAHPRVDVGLEVDGPGYARLWLDTLAGC